MQSFVHHQRDHFLTKQQQQHNDGNNNNSNNRQRKERKKSLTLPRSFFSPAAVRLVKHAKLQSPIVKRTAKYVGANENHTPPPTPPSSSPTVIRRMKQNPKFSPVFKSTNPVFFHSTEVIPELNYTAQSEDVTDGTSMLRSKSFTDIRCMEDNSSTQENENPVSTQRRLNVVSTSLDDETTLNRHHVLNVPKSPSEKISLKERMNELVQCPMFTPHGNLMDRRQSESAAQTLCRSSHGSPKAAKKSPAPRRKSLKSPTHDSPKMTDQRKHFKVVIDSLRAFNKPAIKSQPKSEDSRESEYNDEFFDDFSGLGTNIWLHGSLDIIFSFYNEHARETEKVQESFLRAGSIVAKIDEYGQVICSAFFQDDDTVCDVTFPYYNGEYSLNFSDINQPRFETLREMMMYLTEHSVLQRVSFQWLLLNGF